MELISRYCLQTSHLDTLLGFDVVGVKDISTPGTPAGLQVKRGCQLRYKMLQELELLLLVPVPVPVPAGGREHLRTNFTHDAAGSSDASKHLRPNNGQVTAFSTKECVYDRQVHTTGSTDEPKMVSCRYIATSGQRSDQAPQAQHLCFAIRSRKAARRTGRQNSLWLKTGLRQLALVGLPTDKMPHTPLNSERS
jgi:hypothetical protein